MTEEPTSLGSVGSDCEGVGRHMCIALQYFFLNERHSKLEQRTRCSPLHACRQRGSTMTSSSLHSSISPSHTLVTFFCLLVPACASVSRATRRHVKNVPPSCCHLLSLLQLKVCCYSVSSTTLLFVVVTTRFSETASCDDNEFTAHTRQMLTKNLM